MEHVVFFPAADGSPAFRRVPSLEEAVRLVEHLRNVEGLSTVSVHALAEVPLSFRAYYRVEVPDAVVPVPAQGGAVPVAVAAVAAVEPAVEVARETPALALVEDEPADEPALAAGGGSGPASLGFFA